MATIRTYPWTRHFLGSPTGHVVHLRRGRVAHEGVGQAFWFRPTTSVLSEVPVDDQELPVFFHAVTADHQDVTVQAGVTYRFADPVTVSQRLDFAVDPGSGETSSAGRDQVTSIVGRLAQSRAADALAAMPLADALTAGVPRVRDRRRGHVHDARDPRCRGGVQQRAGALDIDRMEVVRISRERHLRGEVHDPVDSREGGCHGIRIGHRTASIVDAVDARGATLQRAHGVPGLEQRADDGPAEESGRAGDEDSHSGVGFSPARTRSAQAATRVRSILELWRMSVGSAGTTSTAASRCAVAARTASVRAGDASPGRR